jgi:hypothetical protein
MKNVVFWDIRTYVRFEVFTAVTMKNVVFRDIRTYVRFEVFTAVTMKNGVFWVFTPCGSWYSFAAYFGC